MRVSSLIAMAATASAAVIARQDTSPSAKVLLGGSQNIAVAEYNGKEFKITANVSGADAGAASWMAFKEPNLIYAVDENSNFTRLFKYDASANKIEYVTNGTGALGVVSLAFNADKTRLVGTSYSEGKIDIWDITSEKEMKLVKQLQSNDTLGPNAERQDANRAHQAILDPSGRFFAVSDLGSDTVLIVDSKDDAYEIVTRNKVPAAGCGPRHGVWYPAKAKQATHFILACELTNQLQVFSVSYDGTGVAFTRTQELSTYGAAFPPANVTTAAAGEVIVSGDGKDVYVSNRLTGNDTDSIAHFKVKQVAGQGGSPCKPAPGGIELEFFESLSSGGAVPRMFSLSTDEKILFSTNQNAGAGLIAFNREDAGKLTVSSAATIPVSKFGDVGFGPQFVQQIA
ncbi:6-phosphogluconolactonase-like protein 4 [Colletotrichum musicola]|uniref:6-phosphogluconolactonase-like protein 4 n=1 Tax=Colletotrichum musicola TaxID=2175873 RepID=A0A8H6U794_9PEZI|nr:6-phosphogluconolactonase-like protein 4 [Colletotrichum musicola]